MLGLEGFLGNLDQLGECIGIGDRHVVEEMLQRAVLVHDLVCDDEGALWLKFNLCYCRRCLCSSRVAQRLGSRTRA